MNTCRRRQSAKRLIACLVMRLSSKQVSSKPTAKSLHVGAYLRKHPAWRYSIECMLRTMQHVTANALRQQCL